MNKKNCLHYSLFIVVCLILSEIFFFRNILFSNNLFGNNGDGKLTTVIVEHWYNFFRGYEKFGELSMFYPVKNVLAYSDMFLFFGLIHSFFRILGMDMFNAYKYTLILVHVIGTISMFILLNKKFKLNKEWSLFGTIAFSFSSSYAQHLSHTQLMACSMLPILVILIINFIIFFDNKKRRRIYSFLLINWYILILYTAWYIAFFTALFSTIFLSIILLKWIIEKDEQMFKQIINSLHKIWKECLVYIIYISILMFPFIKLYLPVLKKNGGYNYGNSVLYMPELIDLINVGEHNLLFGNIIRKMKLSERLLYEQNMGFSVILIVMFLIFTICFFKKKNLIKKTSVLVSLVLTIIISVLVTIKISSNGVSLWFLIYKVFPGASSIRVPIRYFLYLTFPIAIATSIMGNYIFLNMKNKRQKKYLFILLVVLLWISNIRKGGIDSTWNRTEEKEYLSKIKTPPKKCKVFYIVDSKRKGLPEYVYQNSAFEIANYFRIKTINGNSSQFPDKWFGIYSPLDTNYFTAIYSWINDYKLENVCSYDESSNNWKNWNSILAMQYTTNGALLNNNGTVEMPENSILYGPYVTLPKGKYKVEFLIDFPKNSKGTFEITYTANEKINSLKRISNNQEKTDMEFELNSETPKLEFVLTNSSKTKFIVKDIKLYKLN